MVTLPANPRLTFSAERKLQVVIQAHGPRRVLSVTDLAVCCSLSAWSCLLALSSYVPELFPPPKRHAADWHSAQPRA